MQGAVCVVFSLLDYCVVVLSSPLCSSLGQELILGNEGEKL